MGSHQHAPPPPTLLSYWDGPGGPGDHPACLHPHLHLPGLRHDHPRPSKCEDLRGRPGWPCCSIVNMAGFKEGFFTEGQIDDFSGDDMLEDCYNYSLSQLSNPADLDITVYHEGSDGGALDWIEVSTNKATIRCTLGAFLDGFSNQKGYCA